VGADAVTRIFDAAVRMYTLRLTCACGNSSVFHPHALWWRFHRAGWNDALTKARARFYCRVCWQKHCRKMQPLRIEPCREGPTVHLPMPDDREWKRAVNHNRG
jgi:hypothetical protein